LLHYVPGATFVPHTVSRYYITLSLQTYTSAPHSLREILISIPQATYIPFSHKLFSTHFQWYFYFLRSVYPKNSHNISPPPISGCSQSGSRVDFHLLAVGANIHLHFAPGVSSFLTHNPTLHSTFILCIHLSTTRHKYSFSHSIYSVPTVIPMPFSHSFPTVPSFLRRIYPKRIEFYFFFNNLFLIDNFQRLHCPQSQLETNNNKDFLS
jgi:hypothetical protein